MSRLDELLRELCPDGVEYKFLQEIENSGILTLGRGNVISKIDIERTPGKYPIYSSSALNDGEFGKYGKYMFDDERITWSIDGGGKFFFRKEHKYSVTNVSGWLKVNNKKILDTRYLYHALLNAWVTKKYDYTKKAHPSTIRLEYYLPIPPLEVQQEIVRILDNFTELTAELTSELTARTKQYEFYLKSLFKLVENSNIEVHSKSIRSIGRLIRGKYVTRNDIRPGSIPVILGGQKPAYFGSESNHLGEAIVISRSGAYAGYVSFWNQPIFVTDGFIIETNQEVIIKYLYYYLKSIQDQLHNSKRGGGVPHVRGNEIMKIVLPVPPLEEQARIVSILDRFDTLVNDIKQGLPAEIAARQKQYEYYRDKLLTFKEVGDESI